ncbi:unnamed protein product [Cercopithifilaria johnstoni]|uniref:Uncharacterized protein n=1 Tax=Cercopithifilaria johnstoni TaxID=2874296 RepID=A0A8J2QAS0_9BILA|nr:unnamed protein product [Cercopithifilaria johnstoni]
MRRNMKLDNIEVLRDIFRGIRNIGDQLAGGEKQQNSKRITLFYFSGFFSTVQNLLIVNDKFSGQCNCSILFMASVMTTVPASVNILSASFNIYVLVVKCKIKKEDIDVASQCFAPEEFKIGTELCRRLSMNSNSDRSQGNNYRDIVSSGENCGI